MNPFDSGLLEYEKWFKDSKTGYVYMTHQLSYFSIPNNCQMLELYRFLGLNRQKRAKYKPLVMPVKRFMAHVENMRLYVVDSPISPKQVQMELPL